MEGTRTYLRYLGIGAKVRYVACAPRFQLGACSASDHPRKREPQPTYPDSTSYSAGLALCAVTCRKDDRGWDDQGPAVDERDLMGTYDMYFAVGREGQGPRGMAGQGWKGGRRHSN